MTRETRGTCLVVELDADSVQVEPRRVGTWRFVRQACELTGDADIDALAEWLASLDGKERTILKLSLVGQVSLAQKARLDDLLDHHSDLLGAVEVWERRSDLTVLPDDADIRRSRARRLRPGGLERSAGTGGVRRAGGRGPRCAGPAAPAREGRAMRLADGAVECRGANDLLHRLARAGR